MNRSDGLWKGHVAMLLANIVWGAMSPVSKAVLLDGNISPVALSAIRIAGGAALFWICWLIMPRSVVPAEKVRRDDWIKLFWASVLMISANQGMYIIGIGYTSPIDSAVMSTLTPVFTMILAAIVIAMPVTFKKISGVALGLGGALLMVLGSHSGSAVASDPVLGDTLCLGAQLCAAFYYVLFVPVINRYSPFTMMKWMFTFAALTYVPCTIPWLLEVDFAAVPSVIWWQIGYIVLFATFIAYLLIPYSQRYLKPTVMSMYNYFQPAASALLATLWGVGEFGPLKILATALIFAGVWFVTRSPGRPVVVSDN